MAEEYQNKAIAKLEEAKKIVAEEHNPWDQETKLRKLAEEKMKQAEAAVGGTKSAKDTEDLSDWSDNDEDEHQSNKMHNNLAQKF